MFCFGFLKPWFLSRVITHNSVFNKRKSLGFVAVEESLKRSGVKNGNENEKSPGFIIFIIIICLVSELVFYFLWI